MLIEFIIVLLSDAINFKLRLPCGVDKLEIPWIVLCILYIARILLRKYFKSTEVGTNNFIPKAQLNKAQRSFQPVKAQRKMRSFIFFNFWSAAQLSQWTFSFSWSATQFRNCETAFSYQVKAQPNFRNWNFTTQCKCGIFAILDSKRVNNLLKKADIHHYYDRNEAKLSSMYKIALLTKKKKKKIKTAAQLKRNKF